MKLSEAEQLKIDFAMCISRLVEFFDYDYQKLFTWFYHSNPLLGHTSPFVMMQNGRLPKLIKFINSQLDGNLP